MRKNSVCVGRASKNEKRKSKQGNPKVAPLITQRTIQTEQPKPAKAEQIQPSLSVNTYLSPIEQQKIIEAYVKGKSIRAIASELDRDRETVARIVKAPEVQAAIERGKEEVFGLIPDIVDSLCYGLRNEVNGELALTLGECLGLVPSAQQSHRVEVQQPGQGFTPLNEEEIYQNMKLACAMELARFTIERNEIYGSSLPIEMEELEAMATKRMNEKKASQREQSKES
jgi:hypothetical protein